MFSEATVVPQPRFTILRSPLISLGMVAFLYLIIYVVEAAPLTSIQMIDYWGHLATAKHVTWGEWASWVNPFYPVGYHWLLKLGLFLKADMARFGQMISFLGSLACLGGVYAVVWRVTRSSWYAAATLLLFIAHPVFRHYAMREGTDMLGAGLQLLSLTSLFLFTGKRDRRFLLLAGFLSGLAYLIRYTALTLLPVLLLAIVLSTWRQWAQMGKLSTLFLLTFIITASPQLLPSLIVARNPFYNQQVRNVWFGMYGAFNWQDNWSRAPDDLSLSGLIREDPARFVEHTSNELSRFVTYENDPAIFLDALAIERYVTLWMPLLNHLLWLLGTLLLWFDERLCRAQRVLLFLGLWLPVAVTSTAWLFTRFLLFTLALQIIVFALTLSTPLVMRHLKQPRAWAVVGMAMVLLTFLLATPWQEKIAQTRQLSTQNEMINTVLREAGMQSPTEVVTNSRRFQLVDDPLHAPFVSLNLSTDQLPLTSSELAVILQQQYAARFVVFDWTGYAIRAYDLSYLRPFLPQAEQEFELLYDHSAVSVYCLIPCVKGEEEGRFTP